MTSKNNITGDLIQSRMNSKEFEENFDRIFRKPMTHEEMVNKMLENEEVRKELSRIDIIGANGPTGDHYEYELHPSTGDVEKIFKDGVSKPNSEQFDNIKDE